MGWLPLTPERPGSPLKAVLQETRFNEMDPRFSPDGDWVLYDSDESGRPETYVAPFSQISQRQQISKNGGSFARWRRDGKTVFYVTLRRQLIETEIHISGETVDVGAEHLRSVQTPNTGGYTYDVSPDGQRFLVAIPARSEKSVPITLVQGWSAALNR